MSVYERLKQQDWELIETGGNCLAYARCISPTAYQLLTKLGGVDIPTLLTHPVFLGTYSSETDESLSTQLFPSISSLLVNAEHSNLPVII